MTPLERWYLEHGRHDLEWRSTRDPWAVLVSEVMLAQTQVGRVEAAFPAFMAMFPTPSVAAAAGPGALIGAWGRLGYPRRARRLWEAAVIVAEHGWPSDYQALPGVGPYTAGAMAAQVDDDPSAIGVDVNIRRVVQRVHGDLLTDKQIPQHAANIAKPLLGRDRLLALMDVGAMLCKPREPLCAPCPLRRRCATKGALESEPKSTQPRYEGSMRQRRGVILAALRAKDAVAATEFDPDALATLIADRLVSADNKVVTLARD